MEPPDQSKPWKLIEYQCAKKLEDTLSIESLSHDQKLRDLMDNEGCMLHFTCVFSDIFFI